MDEAHDIIKRQMYSMELRNLAPIQQEVISLWLDLILPSDAIPRHDNFFGTHFSLERGDFKPGSLFHTHRQNLLVMRQEVVSGETDWRYLFKGTDLKKRIGDGERAKSLNYVSEIESDIQRKLILGDLETLVKIQSPYRPRLIWRPYSGFFGSNHEHKTFIRIGMPLAGHDGNVAAAIFMIVEAAFDGRAIIEVT